MKELSIEDKAKLYDEAIIRGSRLWESNMITRENYEYIFPEVKEGEDELTWLKRFIKEEIDCLSFDIRDSEDRVKLKNLQRSLAWLEKQGNLMKALQISNAEIGELIEKNYYLKEQLEKQGNNMGISEATKQELEDNLNKALEKETPESWNKFLDEQGEQKPADKNESRQYELTEFEKAVKQVMEEAIECGDTHNLKADADMLLRLVQKSSWSEEDREMSRFIGNAITVNDASIYLESKGIQVIDAHVWLEELKERVQPQSTWKPSDEQLECLGYAIEKAEKDWSPLTNNRVYLTLKALKEQLLELRGSKV